MSRTVLQRTAAYIARVQTSSGAIPWFAGGVLDPWDHVEAAMGLSVGGFTEQAVDAYRWLARHQLPNGSWFAAYDEDRVADGTRAESNFVAYVATGVWHHYLISRDRTFLAEMWPTVKRALDFVAGLQAPTGEVYWALDTNSGIHRDALITGCSSIYKSLECALSIAWTLGEDPGRWPACRQALGHAIRSRPDRFDRTWESKARYSMDWYYPVLAGVVRDGDANRRLHQRWPTFVVDGLGCRCVADQPWITVAESCELTLACVAAGRTDSGRELYEHIAGYQAEDGSWWTGYAFKDRTLWPDERPTWTAGAVLLAADALDQLTPAARLFTTTRWEEPAQDAQRSNEGQDLEQTRL